MVAPQGQPASRASTQPEPLLAHTVTIYNQAAACPGAAPLTHGCSHHKHAQSFLQKARSHPAALAWPCSHLRPRATPTWPALPADVPFLRAALRPLLLVQGRHGTAWSRHMCSLAGSQHAEPRSSWGGSTVPSPCISPPPARREPREQHTLRSLQPWVSGKQRQHGSTGSCGQPAQLWSPMPVAVLLLPLGTSHLPRGAARGWGPNPTTASKEAAKIFL